MAEDKRQKIKVKSEGRTYTEFHRVPIAIGTQSYTEALSINHLSGSLCFSVSSVTVLKKIIYDNNSKSHP